MTSLRYTPCCKIAAAALLTVMLLMSAILPASSATKFQVKDPVWRVNDMVSINEPSSRSENRIHNLIDGYWLRPLDNCLAINERIAAADLNSIEEVPACSWFTPRIGNKELAGGSVGFGVSGSRSNHKLNGPLTIVAGRIEGPEPYLLVKERDGTSCFVFFDDPACPEMTTAALVISNRILHASGYNVFEAFITQVESGEFIWSDQAQKIGLLGGESNLSENDLNKFLGQYSESHQSGTIRVAVERIPPGEVKGSFSGTATRNDDPNDQIPHENRRSLRALRILTSWLDFSDFNSNRTMDLFVPEGYLKHYLVHSGSALGAGRRLSPPAVGAETPLSVERTGAISQNGLARALGKPKTDSERHRFPGIGDFSAHNFDPLNWQPVYGFEPFRRMDWSDALWGVKLVSAFSDQQIVEAVREGALTEKEARNYLVGTLCDRRDILAHGWLTTINPADDFTIIQDHNSQISLAFTDISIDAGYAQAEDLLYTMEFTLPDLGETVSLQSHGGYNLNFNLSTFAPANWLHRKDPRRYCCATLKAYNYANEALHGETCVHIYFEADGDARVIGIERL